MTFKSANFSDLWTEEANASVLGFIGGNFQRLRIKFIQVQRDKLNPFLYHLTGKTLVNANLCRFSGTLTIEQIRPTDDHNIDDKSVQVFSIVGSYTLNEEASQKNSGLFSGVFLTAFYQDSDKKILYNDLAVGADGYRNNQYVGTWTSYTTKTTKPCNWGDSRIPDSGDLDTGSGEFIPARKYRKFGWQTYADAYEGNNPTAQTREQATWWK